MTDSFWQGRRVFVTGHTGFMGSWLAVRLTALGAEVTGYALPAPTDPAMFDAIGLQRDIHHIVGDVRDSSRLSDSLRDARPDVVFHLAAQPLVRRAFVEPVETFSTNVMGTVNVLDAIRHCGTVSAAVVVTTDKVYRNQEWDWGYRETDVLGGHEPYGASKACAEFVTYSYVKSYFTAEGPLIATVRAGNIVGGGDWARDRLIPDAARAFAAARPLTIRHPDALRPWQHVLEPVTGMMDLANGLAGGRRELADAWNLGPREDESRAVAWVADRFARAWGDGAAWRTEPADGPSEAKLLTLSSNKARSVFGWECRWDTDEALARAAHWYRAYYDGADMATVTHQQINDYIKGEDRGSSQRKEILLRNREVA